MEVIKYTDTLQKVSSPTIKNIPGYQELYHLISRDRDYMGWPLPTRNFDYIATRTNNWRHVYRLRQQTNNIKLFYETPLIESTKDVEFAFYHDSESRPVFIVRNNLYVFKMQPQKTIDLYLASLDDEEYIEWIAFCTHSKRNPHQVNKMEAFSNIHLFSRFQGHFIHTAFSSLFDISNPPKTQEANNPEQNDKLPPVTC